MDEKEGNEIKAEEAPEKSEEKVQAKKDDAEGLKDRLMRLAAEFDNYKKRVAKDMDNSKGHGKAEVIAKLLTTLDEFELALKSFDKNDEKHKGIALVYANFVATLRGFGLKDIETEGVFDPYKHEIVLSVESGEKEGTIIEVVRKGYSLNGIMLRPASVMVSKGTKAGDKENKTT